MLSFDPQSIHDLLHGDIDTELENVLNHPAPAYSESKYWNERYMRYNYPFDWFQPWTSFRSIILPLIPNKNLAINLGCGNSPMTMSLVQDGFQHVIGYDISPVVIDQNKKKYINAKHIEWEVGNVFDLSKYQDDTFDAVFDKGTFDSLMSAGITVLQISQFLTGVSRILQPNGVFVLISYGTPSSRLSWLQNSKYGWSVIANEPVENMAERGYYHYVYCLQKKAKEDSD